MNFSEIDLGWILFSVAFVGLCLYLFFSKSNFQKKYLAFLFVAWELLFMVYVGVWHLREVSINYWIIAVICFIGFSAIATKRYLKSRGYDKILKD
jgi:hypothetical protein